MRELMSGNICRCGAYPNIVAAVREVQTADKKSLEGATMNLFRYARAEQTAGAIRQVGDDPKAAFLAGGTSLIDLMRLNVEAPGPAGGRQPTAARQDRSRRRRRAHRGHGAQQRSGLPRAHPDADFPVLSEALALRGVAAAAQHGHGRRQPSPAHALLRTSATRRPRATSATPVRAAPRWTATTAPTPYSAPATSASRPTPRTCAWRWSPLDAVIKVQGPKGERSIPIDDFHLVPGDTPERETVLRARRTRHGRRVAEPAVRARGRTTSRSATGPRTSSPWRPRPSPWR